MMIFRISRRPRTAWRSRLKPVATFLFFLTFCTPAFSQVYVQDSPAAAELLAEAQDRLDKGEPEQAARQIQRVFDEHGAKLLEIESGRYSETRGVAMKKLSGNADLLRAYRLLFDPPAAQSLDTAGHDREQLHVIVQRFEATDAGLDAALRLAGLDLERGEASSAATMLEHFSSHPALEKRLSLWRQLSACAALMLDRKQVFDTHRKALMDLGETKAVEWLDGFSQWLVHVPPVLSLSPLDPLPDAKLHEQLKEPLWSVPIGGAERFMVRTYNIEPGQLEDQFARGKYLNVMPLLTGGVLYINDGFILQAIEPSSGRALWQQRLTEEAVRNHEYGRFTNTWLPNGLDLNGLAATGQHVVAITGFGAASMMYPSFVPVPSATVLSCVDAKSGKLLWNKRPDQLDPDMADAFWYGRPLISDGRVYVTLRRRQRTQFQDGYIAALELATGRLVWRRHLGSVAISSRSVIPPLAHFTLDDGWLYVDTKLGTVARLSSVDGSVDWLTTPMNEFRLRTDHQNRPWEAGAPVLIPAGLIIMDELNERVRLLDPSTGEEKKTFPAQGWGWPIYIAKSGRDLVSVGQKLLRINGETFETVWEYEGMGEEIRGRVAVTPSRLLVPVSGSLRVIRLDDGRLEKTVPIETPANAIVLNGQVITVQRGASSRDGGDNWVRSYSTWEVASEQLRARAAASPADPHPLLSLAWLAIHTGRDKELVEAVDEAVKVTQDAAGPDARGEVFGQLVEMVDREPPLDAAVKSDLFDRLAVVAQGPRDEVTYRLLLARDLESRGKIAQAVEMYQAVLADSDYRKQVFRWRQTAHLASLDAQKQLHAILVKHGPDSYAEHDAYAQRRLEELQHEVDPAALVELAESHPVSHSAPRALILAGMRAAERGDALLGISLLRRAGAHPLIGDLGAEALSHEAELLARAGETRRAVKVLRQLLSRYPSQPVLRGGQPVEVEKWITELSLASPPEPSLVQEIELPFSKPVAVLPAGWLRATAQDPDAPPFAGVLLQSAASLEWRDATGFMPRWRAGLTPGEKFELLSASQSRLWLWDPIAGKLQVRTTADGNVLWQDEQVAARLEAIKVTPLPKAPEPQAPQRFQRGGRVVIPGGFPGFIDPNAQRPVTQQRVPLRWAVSDVVAAVADEHGRLVVFDALTGEVRWQTASLVRKTSHLLLDGRYVTIAGHSELGEPQVSVYHAMSGEVAYDDSLTGTGLAQSTLWIGQDDAGRLVHVTHRKVELFDLARGDFVWTLKPGFQLFKSSGSWVADGKLVLQIKSSENADGGDLVRVDLSDGKLLDRIPLHGAVESPVQILRDRGQWLVVGSNRCLALGEDGQPVWRDAINGGQQFLDFAVTGQHLFLLAAPAGPEPNDSTVRHLYVLDRKTGLLKNEQRLDGDSSLDRLAIVGRRLLVGGDNATAVFGPAPN